MKAQNIFNTLLTFAVLLGASAFTVNQVSETAEASLKVKVSGVKTTEGKIHILLFNQAIGFPANPAKAYKKVTVKATSGEVTTTIGMLPAGKYSIVAFHDKNGNDAFDKSWFGSPEEDYGFSNIPGEFCGTPSFQQTSFEVTLSANAITVKLINVE